MVLVLGLSPSFPHRDVLVTMTFGVVIVSILLQGLTMGPLLRRLGIVGAREERHAYELERCGMRAASVALDAIDRMAREGNLHPETAASLAREYRERAEGARERLRLLHLEANELRQEEEHAARRHLLLVEKDAALRDYHAGLLGQHAFEGIVRDIDARLFELEAGEAREPAGSGAPQAALQDDASDGSRAEEPPPAAERGASGAARRQGG